MKDTSIFYISGSKNTPKQVYLQRKQLQNNIKMKTIEKVRTPESEFKNLKDYSFAPNYMELKGAIRMHYLDEGSKNKKTIFLFHGQPSWSYLYRHIIPQLVAAGYRVIAPDLIGFGKSDKPIHSDDISYQAEVDWMTEFIDKLAINNAAAFMQDWGGMVGLRVLANRPEWLDRLIVANTDLGEMKGLEKFMVPKVLKIMAALAGKATVKDFERKMNYGNWAGYFRHAEKFEIGKLMQILTTRDLSQEEQDAYDAPFPNYTYYTAPRKMPEIVASDLDEAYADWQKLKQWRNPVLTLFSDKDPFLAGKGMDKKFQTNFSGAKAQPHITIENASHFLQEDKSGQLTDQILNWLEQTKY